MTTMAAVDHDQNQSQQASSSNRAENEEDPENEDDDEEKRYRKDRFKEMVEMKRVRESHPRHRACTRQSMGLLSLQSVHL